MAAKIPARRLFPAVDPRPSNWGRLSDTLGLKILSRRQGFVRMRLPWSRQVSQMAGFLHGGALFTLADTAAAVGVLKMLPEGWSTVTGELKINFIGNIRSGAAVAEAQLLHWGRKTTVWEVKVCEEGKKRLLAVALGTFFLLPPRH